MDRRTFLKSSGLTTLGGLTAAGLSATATLAGTEVRSEARRLTVATQDLAPDFDAALSVRRIAERLEAASGRQVQLIAAPGAADADFSVLPVSRLSEAHAAWAAVTPLVADLAPRQLDGWLSAGGGDALLEELAFDSGLRIFPVGRAATLSGISVSDPEVWGLLAVTDDGYGFARTDDGREVFRLEAAPAEGNVFALRQPLAGELVLLVTTAERFDDLTESERGLLTTVAQAEYGIVGAEADTLADIQIALGRGPTRRALPLGHETRQRTALRTRRAALSDESDIGRQIVESLSGFVELTRISAGV